MFSLIRFALLSFLICTIHLSVPAQDYYPLAVGNEWFYRAVDSLPGDSTIESRVRVVGDTLLASGRRYFILSTADIMEGRYIRTDSAFVWYLNPYSGAEQRVFKLNGAVGDTTTIGWGAYAYVRVIAIDTALVLGMPLRVITYYADGLLTARLRLCERLGPLTEWRYSDPPAPWPDWGREFVGCIVGGTHYGRTLDVRNEPGFATEFHLSQNYPNPFNPSTTISFSLPRTENISLKVYDMLGREVATLVEGQEEAGEHSVKWNAEGLASGVYFSRLIAGGFVEARKLLLNR
jgi:hypothetical protein